MLVRLDGAGFSHELLEHIAAGGGKRGRHWEFSVGWSCTDVEMDAIARLPKAAWTPGIDQDGDVLDDTFAADLTGLLDLDAWTARIPGLRILVREEPLHPRYRKRATEREKQLGKRYQLIATSTQAGQIAWLDARHRSHVHVENDVKQAKALGLNRWPSRHWTINVAWTQIVALAANLLACFRHLALPAGELRQAAPKLLRFRLLHIPARLTRGQRKRWLHLRADWPWTTDLISAWHAVSTLPVTALPRHRRPDDPGRSPAGTWNPAPPTRQPDPDHTRRTDFLIKNQESRSRGQPCYPREKSRPGPVVTGDVDQRAQRRVQHHRRVLTIDLLRDGGLAHQVGGARPQFAPRSHHRDHVRAPVRDKPRRAWCIAEADFAELIEEAPVAGFIPKSELSAGAIRRIMKHWSSGCII